MASTIGKWNIQTNLDAQPALKGMDSLTISAKNLQSTLTSLFGGGGIGAVGGLFGGAAVTSVISGFERLTASVKHYVDEGTRAIRLNDRLAHSLGTTREAAAGMLGISAAAGQSPEEFQSAAMQGLRHIGELRLG